MVQGAANYAWNLIEEAWAMVWKSRNEFRGTAVEEGSKSIQHIRGEMREVNPRLGETTDPKT
jgi:hypothetical protein